MKKPIAIFMAALLAASVPAAPVFARADQDFSYSTDSVASRVIQVAKDKSAAFRLSVPASQIVVAQPDIAEIVANTDRNLYVRGKAYGVTNILIYDVNHRLAEVIDVKVGYDIASLQSDLGVALPGEAIRAQAMAGGVMLTGEASTTSVAARAKLIAERYAPQNVSSSVTVRAAQQVMLEVRIIEVTRSSLKDLGVNLDVHNLSGFTLATGTGLVGNNPAQGTLGISTNVGTLSLDATLRALEEKGVIRTLARPNLAAISGEEATFLAGGEFPYPVPNGLDSVTIEFKPFGVTLKFTPTVQDGGLIRLKVAPEVSSLDSSHAVKIGNFELPSLLVRRAATTIELKDGETFAIAGLFQQDYANTVRQIPWAGDLPVLGALFRSARWRKQETELVILVTPRMTTAADSRLLAPQPLIATTEPTALDMILQGIAQDRPMSPAVGQSPAPEPALVTQ
ncbi:pilus assembly protein CpaC [Caulobacter ginsengisoli]|uniref:Pilus assembly protein CpaC n=1 Tax=Caulobacter ginsengisoli TaxID=400775 RepID=A0ABU0IU80_9CAUL|nr:type II and III secretion system protein family protein [Caulobacter ginsengisoli]MDQ0464698.1 pilus assembly protein CpaC [Caulobacter ginsengisoli]